jgi:hypothetical protein
MSAADGWRSQPSRGRMKPTQPQTRSFMWFVVAPASSGRWPALRAGRGSTGPLAVGVIALLVSATLLLL